MTHAHRIDSALFIAALLALPLAQAAGLGKAEYQAGKASINADYKADRMACDPLAGHAKDLCQALAKAKEQVSLAEIEYTHSGKIADEREMWTVRANTDYDVSKERCADLTGNAKSVCVEQARAWKVKALAEIKMEETIGQAERDAMSSWRDADYKVAAEKCDAMSGDVKTNCLNAAKLKYGKS